jgi:hypothetical protein
MWHKILYRGRKSIIGRLLIFCWAVLFLSTVLLFSFPKSFLMLGPMLHPFAFFLVLTTMIYGVLMGLKALLKRHSDTH